MSESFQAITEKFVTQRWRSRFLHARLVSDTRNKVQAIRKEHTIAAFKRTIRLEFIEGR